MKKKSFKFPFLCENPLTGYTLGAGYTLGVHCSTRSPVKGKSAQSSEKIPDVQHESLIFLFGDLL
jgi:hypothetical protein